MVFGIYRWIIYTFYPYPAARTLSSRTSYLLCSDYITFSQVGNGQNQLGNTVQLGI